LVARPGRASVERWARTLASRGVRGRQTRLGHGPAGAATGSACILTAAVSWVAAARRHAAPRPLAARATGDRRPGRGASRTSAPAGDRLGVGCGASVSRSAPCAPPPPGPPPALPSPRPLLPSPPPPPPPGATLARAGPPSLPARLGAGSTAAPAAAPGAPRPRSPHSAARLLHHSRQGAASRSQRPRPHLRAHRPRPATGRRGAPAARARDGPRAAAAAGRRPGRAAGRRARRTRTWSRRPR